MQGWVRGARAARARSNRPRRRRPRQRRRGPGYEPERRRPTGGLGDSSCHGLEKALGQARREIADEAEITQGVLAQSRMEMTSAFARHQQSRIRTNDPAVRTSSEKERL